MSLSLLHTISPSTQGRWPHVPLKALCAGKIPLTPSFQGYSWVRLQCSSISLFYAHTSICIKMTHLWLRPEYLPLLLLSCFKKTPTRPQVWAKGEVVVQLGRWNAGRGCLYFIFMPLDLLWSDPKCISLIKQLISSVPIQIYNSMNLIRPRSWLECSGLESFDAQWPESLPSSIPEADFLNGQQWSAADSRVLLQNSEWVWVETFPLGFDRDSDSILILLLSHGICLSGKTACTPHWMFAEPLLLWVLLKTDSLSNHLIKGLELYFEVWIMVSSKSKEVYQGLCLFHSGRSYNVQQLIFHLGGDFPNMMPELIKRPLKEV